MSEMSEVKRRYSLWWGSEEEEPYMVEDEDGKYAHYSDWQSEHEARLAAEAKAAREERALEVLAELLAENCRVGSYVYPEGSPPTTTDHWMNRAYAQAQKEAGK